MSALTDLGVAGIVPRAERHVRDAVGARLAAAHRVLVEADRVELAELDDLVVDLHRAEPRMTT